MGFSSPRNRKFILKLINLWCVMSITAHLNDENVIFTACSDAPHKAQLLQQCDLSNLMLIRRSHKGTVLFGSTNTGKDVAAKRNESN